MRRNSVGGRYDFRNDRPLQLRIHNLTVMHICGFRIDSGNNKLTSFGSHLNRSSFVLFAHFADKQLVAVNSQLRTEKVKINQSRRPFVERGTFIGIINPFAKCRIIIRLILFGINFKEHLIIASPGFINRINSPVFFLQPFAESLFRSISDTVPALMLISHKSPGIFYRVYVAPRSIAPIEISPARTHVKGYNRVGNRHILIGIIRFSVTGAG